MCDTEDFLQSQAQIDRKKSLFYSILEVQLILLPQPVPHRKPKCDSLTLPHIKAIIHSQTNLLAIANVGSWGQK